MDTGDLPLASGMMNTPPSEGTPPLGGSISGLASPETSEKPPAPPCPGGGHEVGFPPENLS